MTTRWFAATMVALVFATSLPAADDEGFKPLFNGKDLTGWVNVNCHPDTFYVKDGEIITTGKPTGYLRTDRPYENFVLEFDWMHTNKKEVGNSGLFVWGDPLPAVGTPYTRGIEVQVLVNLNVKDSYTSHGDIFSIWGAKCKPDRPHPKGWERCLPSELRAKGGGEWNHYKVTGNNGVIKLEVNGKEVSGVSECHPRKGYLALESEGAECRFKNIKLKELPSTGATSKDSAEVAQDFRPLLLGDLSGWKADDDHQKLWKPIDWRMRYNGNRAELKIKGSKDLWSEKEYGDFELVCDWKFDAKYAKKMKRPIILSNGDYDKDDSGKNKEVEVLDAGDSGIYVRGSSKSQINMWCWPIGSGEVYGYRMDPKMSQEVKAGVTPKEVADNKLGQWNRFHITMKGDRLTVILNKKKVIDNAQLPGVAPRGSIALQDHGDPVEFANVFIRELN